MRELFRKPNKVGMIVQHNLIETMESSVVFMSETDQRLARYILSHKQDVLSMPIKELAEKSKGSEATVVRFARSMDTKGFSDFKLRLSASLAPEPTQAELANIESGDSAEEIVHKLTRFAVKSLHSTEQLIDPNELSKAAELIYRVSKKGGRIYAAGSGASSTLVEQFQLKMMRLGIPIIYYKDAHLQLESFLNVSKDDVLVAFTTLGRSSQTKQLMMYAKDRKTKVILITQYGNKGLAKNADIELLCSSIENSHRLVSATSLITQAIIIDALFFLIAVKDYASIQNDVEDTRKQFVKFGFYTQQ